MKKMLLLFLLLVSGLTLAQTTITIGTQVVQSGTSGISPYNYYWESRRVQFVYTAAEILAAGGFTGNISAIAFDVSQINGGNLVNYTVRMAQTTAIDASSHNTAALTEVKSAHTLTPGSTGWRNITFDQNFNWNSSFNLLVDVCWGVNSGYASNGQVWLYNNVTNQMRSVNSSSSNQCGISTTTTRSGKPRVQLTITAPASLDMGATALALPLSSGCYGSSETVSITIKNYGSATIDFATNNVTVNASVTGPNPVTFTPVVLGVGDGTLLSGATKDVVVSTTYNMSAAGTYTFNASTSVTGDGNAGNDAMAPANRTVTAPTALPYSEGFSSGVFPATWTNTSSWLVSTNHGNTNYGIYKNLYSTVTSAQFTMLKLGPATANSELQFDYRIVNYASSPPYSATPNSPAWGNIQIQVSSDCGLSFSTLATIDPTNHISTASWATKNYSLGTFAGYSVIIKIVATWSAGDYFVDFDNFNVLNVVPMSYSSSSVTQNNTSATVVGSTNQEIIGIQIVTTGSLSPISVSKFRVNANGSSSVANIENATIYYTGTTSTFAAINPFGTVAAISDFNDFDIAGTQPLVSGTNYFWLTYDIKSGATVGHVVDGECTQVNVASTDYAPSPTSVTGSRLIKGPLSGNYTVGTTLFNAITGKNIYYEKKVEKTWKEVEVEVPQIKSKNQNSINQTPNSVESILQKSTTQLVEVEDVTWVPMENGQIYNGQLFANRSDNPEYSFPEGIEGVYSTITAAIADLNLLGVSGWVSFSLTDASYTTGETYPIVINQVSGASVTNTVTIKPNAGNAAVISGSSAVAIFKLNGADYITIDGLNAGGSSLQIENTNNGTSSAVIWIASTTAPNGATNNTIQNCTLKGNAPTTTLSCIVSSGSAVGGVAEAQNNNNIFTKNVILKTFYGIAAVGPTGNENGLVISNNTLGSSTAGDKIGFNGIAIFQQADADVSGNTIFGVVTATTATTSGIRVSGTANGIDINSNKIYDVKNTNSTGYGANGIQLNSSSSPANVTVSNNFISDVAGLGYSLAGVEDNGYGIILVTGGGYNIYHNSVNLNTNQSVLTGLPAVINITSGITAANSVDIRNNLFINTQTFGTQRYAIYSGAANTVYANIDYNNYVTSGANLGYLITNRLDLAAWKAATNQDVFSKTTPVTFSGAPDLHLFGASIGDQNLLGTYLLGYDIDGDTRLGPPAGPYMGADEGPIALPVELNLFTAKAKNRNVILNWQTKTEVNSALFKIERMKENTNEWLNVGMLQAAGNSNSPVSYSFTDSKLQSGKYSYRLKMIDANGSYRYSDAIEAEVGLPKEYAISQNYPNPFNPSTKIDYQLPFDSKVTLELFGITGEKIATLINSDLSAGYYTSEVNASALNLASGIYIYRMTANGGNNQTFSQVKKLMLMK